MTDFEIGITLCLTPTIMGLIYIVIILYHNRKRGDNKEYAEGKSIE